MASINNPQLWLIGDQKEIFDGLIKGLYSNGYTYKQFIKISDALDHLNERIPEAILVDADHSEVSCLEFCYRLKISSIYKKTKLFILSSNNTEEMEASVFDAGADEFIPKPLRVFSLLKRISRRLDNSFSSVLFKIKGKPSLQIDKESFTVYLNQILIPLSRKEFELLYLLACHPGKVFSREEIFYKVWKRNHVSKERTIDVHMLRLRKKIGEDFFSTQKGVGYRFCAYN
jgi:two-component system alkaline phosphatase synthesis response regulator PhoP